MIDWRQWMPIPSRNLGNFTCGSDDETARSDYWSSRHWAVPSLYTQDDWYANEAMRLRERAPA